MEENQNREIVEIEETGDAPQIILDKESFSVKIAGSSFPENAIETYQPVIHWLSKLEDSNSFSELTCDFHYHYINSASKKIVYEILRQLEIILRQGKTVRIKWYYDFSDDDIYELGQEYSEIVNVPFEFIGIEPFE